MSRKNKYKRVQGVNTDTPSTAIAGKLQKDNGSSSRLTWILTFFIFVVAIGMYSQTISYEYTLDDLSAIRLNKVVKQGLSGIPELLKTDYWYGYTDKLRGQQYRPLSLVMFAIEYQFFPLNPKVGHLMNVLLFTLTCCLLFMLLSKLVNRKSLLFPFVVVLLYTTHPVHTEVVSNIKSRDEILCFLFAIVAMLAALRFQKSGNFLWAVVSGISLLFSIMSKETGIAFILLIPLTLFVFRTMTLKKMFLISGFLGVFVGVYFILMYTAVHNVKSMEIILIDNTLLLASSTSETFGTAISILLRYIGLLLFPISLSYDYSYSQIPIVNMSNPMALMGLMIYGAITIYALWKIRKKNYYAYGFLFFLITLAPVSNLFLKIGSTMAERFLYMPSFGFCIVLGLILIRLFESGKERMNYFTINTFFKKHSLTLIVTFFIIMLYAIKTISRNKVWENNTTLFASGIITAENSARTHYNWGFQLVDVLYPATNDPFLKQEYLSTAKAELETAINIFPGYFEVGKPMGEVLLKLNDFKNAILYYDKYLEINPYDILTLNNKAAALINLKNYNDAQKILEYILTLSPSDTSALKNMGKSFAYLSDFSSAARYFEKTITQAPGISENYRLAGMAYQFMGDTAKAKEYLQKAASLK